MADVKWSQFPSVTPGNSDEVVGLHSGDNARFSIANIVAAVRQGLASIFVPLTRTINGKGLSADITLDSSGIDYDNTASGLTADNVQDALDELAQGGGGGGSAANVTYDPTTSGLTATDVQAAIDEVVDDLDGKQSKITASGILKGDGAGGVSAATPGTDYALPARPKKYLFVGDSYSVLSSNWVDFCAQYLGLSASQYVNAGVSGTGFIVDRNGNIGSAYNGFLDCIQAVTADRETYTDVVICGGINDAQYDTYQSFLGDHIKATITYIKTNFPNAMPHIGFIGGALETSSVLYGRTLLRRKVALYGYITAAIPYYLNGVENAIHQSAYCYGSDGLHPNATGSELIGMAVAQAIQNGTAEVYQSNSLNLSYPSPWSISGEDITLNVHNDTAQLTINTASMIFNAGGSQNAQTYSRSTGLVMTLPNSLRINRRYSVQCGIQLRNRDNTWTLVYGDWVLEGTTLTMFPVVLSGSGFQSVTTSLLSILSDVVFNLRTEDIN